MVRYTSVKDAKKMDGLRLALLEGFASSWGIAARHILDLKAVPYVPVGAKMGLSMEIIGVEGLAWTKRLYAFSAFGSKDVPGEDRKDNPLGYKYSNGAAVTSGAAARVTSLLKMLSDRLHAQKAKGSSMKCVDSSSRYYVGDSMTAVDIYSAALINIVKPLDATLVLKPVGDRWDVTKTGPEEAKALIEGDGAIILEHRRQMYENELKGCLGPGQSYDNPDSWSAFINPE